MNYDFYNTGVYGQSNKLPETVEERSRKNERKRIMSMIRSYERNQDRYSPKEVLKVQQLADMYDIPWSPNRPKPTFAQKGAAFAGGILDTGMLDMIPDKWYTAKGAEGARELGAMLGIPLSVAAAILAAPASGGASLAGGASAVRGALSGAKGVAGLAKAIPGVGSGVGQMAKAGLGMVPSVGLAKLGVGGAQKVMAPMMQKYGVGTGTKFVKKGVEQAVRKNKRELIQELRTLKGGTNNKRAVEILKDGAFSADEVRKYANMVLRNPGGRAPATVKPLVDAMVTEVGVTAGGKLSSSVITKLGQNAGNMVKISGPRAKTNVTKWVERTFGASKSAGDKQKIVKNILDDEADTVAELLMKGMRKGGKAPSTASVKPDYSGLGAAALGGGILASGGLGGTNPEVDPLRPYYDATVG